MPGSKKGERRGGAKPGRVRKSKPPSGATPIVKRIGNYKGRTVGQANKSKFDPQIGVILNRDNSPLEKERELEMYFLIVGKRMRLPKEVMLDAMRYLEETGIEWAEVVRENMKALADSETVEARAVFERAIEFAEVRVREYILLAVDVAYKAAQYVHPRLAAVITNPGSGESPLNAIAALFRDLDEAGKPARYIDHDAGDIAK